MPLVKQKSAPLGRALLEAEDVFNRLLKMFGDEERQLQRGDVVALFHRADGLAACPDRLGESFSTGLDFALSFVLALVTIFVSLVPFLILITIPLIFVIRYVRKKRRAESVADSSTDDNQN